MLLVGMMQWWWTTGWKMFASKFVNKLRDAADFFSIRLLVENMFAPFRQISVGTVANQSLSAQISVFFDKLLSRLVGTVVRFFLLIVGLILLLAQSIIGLVVLILWPLAPFMVALCLILAVMQVTF